MQARDLMTADPYVVTPNESVWRAAEIMRDLDIGMVPVVEDLASRRLVGVITDRDIAVRCVAEKHSAICAVRDHMSNGELATAPADASSDTVLDIMAWNEVRRLPVVAAGNRLLGIISQADLAVKLGNREPIKVERFVERVSSRHMVATH